MSASNWMQIVLVIIALILFSNAWTTPAPYGGDAGIGDAVEKLFCYGLGGLLLLGAAIWWMVGK